MLKINYKRNNCMEGILYDKDTYDFICNILGSVDIMGNWNSLQFDRG